MNGFLQCSLERETSQDSIKCKFDCRNWSYKLGCSNKLFKGYFRHRWNGPISFGVLVNIPVLFLIPAEKSKVGPIPTSSQPRFLFGHGMYQAAVCGDNLLEYSLERESALIQCSVVYMMAITFRLLISSQSTRSSFLKQCGIGAEITSCQAIPGPSVKCFD